MKKLFIIIPVMIVLGAALIACKTPPTDEMNKAQDAVTRAENDADAVAYAGNTVAAARDALTKMMNEANAKRYDAAKKFAAEAISNAEKAIADGKAGAARARDEAANLLNSLKTPLEDTANAINAAKQVKNAQLDFNALSGDMDQARQTFSDAQNNLDANNYSGATAKGQIVRSMLADINGKITSAVQAASRKK